MPTIGPRWDALPCDDAAAETLAAALGIAPVVAKLLCQTSVAVDRHQVQRQVRLCRRERDFPTRDRPFRAGARA